MKIRYFIIFLTALFITGISCNRKNSDKQKLIIFHAGSLSLPFKEIKEEFEKKNPEINVILESAGSVQCARKITDLKKDCDIMASADYQVIDDMLIPEYADWNIKFASNEMAIVFHDDSKYSDEINSQNWHEILLRDDVFFGRSDPNSDPCGYRAILTTKLAQEYYKIPDLTEKITAKDNEYIRPKEVDLLALLESNTIDYIFLYRSVAEQHGLKYIILSDSVNLKNPELTDLYRSVKVQITGDTPDSSVEKIGGPMVYGVTILKNSTKQELAIKFVDFLLSKENGMRIIEKSGQPTVIPAFSETFDKIPQKLKDYAKTKQ